MRIPSAVLVPAPLHQERSRTDAAAQGGCVLPVGGKDVVSPLQGTDRTHLRRLLSERHEPQAQLALPLQGKGFLVQAPRANHVAVEPLRL